MSHRYWRIRVTDTEDGSSCTIGELELRGSIGGADLTGSGTAFTGGNGFDEDDAFDGNAATIWHSGFDLPSIPNVLGYDFGPGNDELVVQIAITADSSSGGGEQAPEDFTIQYSDNNSSWTTAATFNNESPWSDGETRTFATGLTPPVTETGVTTLTLSHAAEETGSTTLTLNHVLGEFGKSVLTLEHAVEQFGSVSLGVSHVLSEFGTASLTLNHNSIPITGVTGLVLRHDVTATGVTSLTVDHDLIPLAGKTTLTLHHAPVNTGASVLTVNHQPQQAAAGTSWQVKVWLDGDDVTDQVNGQIEIEANKGAARLADFVLRPEPGVLDPQSYVKKPVAIDYLTYSGSTLQTNHRRFTGVVDDATFDPVTRLVSFACTDDLQGSLEAQEFDLIDEWIGGDYSPVLFNETDDGWEYAQQRLASQAASYDKDVFGFPRKWSWLAKSTPDIAITEADVVDGSISLTQSTSRDVVNEVEISFSFAYARQWQRELRAFWKYSRRFSDYLVLSSDLPNRDMFISAIDRSWWVKSIGFTKLPASGTYDTESGLVNWVINEDLRDSLIFGANAVLAKRWIQDINENYTIIVKAPASIARFGVAKQVNRYAWQVPVNESFEEVQQSSPALDDYGNLTTSSYQPPPVGSTQIGDDYYLDDDQRSTFNQAIKTTIAIAQTDILESHHKNEVTVTTLLQPFIDVGDTVEVDTTPIEAIGTVGQLSERYDIDEGLAQSTISINVFAPNVDDQDEDAIAVPAKPNSDPDEQTIDLGLNTYLGGSDVTTPHDPDWRGFLGNYGGLSTFNSVTYPHEFRLETPDLSEDLRDQKVVTASSETLIAIPQETLAITVTGDTPAVNYLTPTTNLTPTTEMSDFS